MGIFVTPRKSTSNSTSRPKRTRKKKRTTSTDESEIIKNKRNDDLQIQISEN